ncbi:hypothetical protein EOE18_04640 [Novosphingobium umbonatum]|uniref:Uncharacterized protein n=1 Tax=Novosphingobium umbonatum TaxID=1908524 RepID=A0A437N898_9SPHN|nr:hypothetical protein [Novosphingobium umbonatum]RVU06140.1 hypothetical protein EOE18_04640 [Novosphingobium umbonatum]
MPIPSASALPATGSKRLALAQGSVLAIVLAVCTLWPRAGQPLLLVALDRQEALSFAHTRGEALLGAGRLPGSIVVQGAGSTSALDALRQGILPLAAPDLLCTMNSNPSGQSSEVSPAPMAQQPPQTTP